MLNWSPLKCVFLFCRFFIMFQTIVLFLNGWYYRLESKLTAYLNWLKQYHSIPIQPYNKQYFIAEVEVAVCLFTFSGNLQKAFSLKQFWANIVLCTIQQKNGTSPSIDWFNDWLIHTLVNIFIMC